MWIKHDNALYNTNDISEIWVAGAQIRAMFSSNCETKVIGQFKNKEEAGNVFQSIVKSLLFEDSAHPGMIIKSTKKERKTNEKN